MEQPRAGGLLETQLMDEPALRVVSVGAGVQSTRLCLGILHGELPPVSFGVFSDTGWEPGDVYRNLTWLTETVAPAFPIYRVQYGLLRSDALAKRSGTGMPVYTESPKKDGRGRLGRGCTRTYKIQPKNAFIKAQLGYPGRKHVPWGVYVEQWFGISLEEAVRRMRVEDETWMKYRYPLVYDIPSTRQECIEWIRSKGYPIPPRSACIGCPFHSPYEWRDMKNNRPEEFADAVEFDDLIRPGMRGAKQRCFLHSSLKPLSEVDFSTNEDHGQLNLFDNECLGVCGV